MKKLSDLSNVDNLSVNNLFQIRGGACVAIPPTCSTKTCTNLTGVCTSQQCTSQQCAAHSTAVISK